MPGLLETLREAERELTICNSCRYCEGLCAVFPAVELRTSLTKGDLTYLANLCHDCRACYQACMYAPPHEFAVNLPRALSEVRAETYAEFAWPRWLATMLRRPWAVASVAAVALVLGLAGVALTGGGSGFLSAHLGPGAFYRILPWLALMVPSLAVSLFVVAVLLAGTAGLIREAGGTWRSLAHGRVWGGALVDGLRLRYLGGGGGNCYYPEAETPSSSRRILHGLVLGGFLAAFLSTTIAAIEQDLLHLDPPYPLLSAPVILGTAGGVAMVIGCAGLLWLKRSSTSSLAAPAMTGMDTVFLLVLGLGSLTGLLTLALRATPLLGPALVVHVAVLAALYVTAPYGKFVHWVYRLGALLQYRAESRAGRVLY